MPRIYTTRPLHERLWEKVDRTGGPESCWLWIGSKANRYGKLEVAGKARGVHVISWELRHGPVPDGLCVCHNCPGGDNPYCVNPAHLFLGSNAENIRDRDRKGRTARGAKSGKHTHPESTARGSQHGRAKITEHDVRAIRIAAAAGTTYKAIAARFGISDSAIGFIVHQKTWRHVA